MKSFSLGVKLGLARIIKGLSQQEAADIIGYDRSMISRIESYYAKKLSLVKLVQFASIYETSLADLLSLGEHDEYKLNDAQIVLVEDTKTQSLIYQTALSKALPAAHIHVFEDAETAYNWLYSHQADIVITDYKLPGHDGQKLLKRMRKTRLNKHTTSVLMTDKINPLMARQIAAQESALFYNKHEPTEIFVQLVLDALRVS